MIVLDLEVMLLTVGVDLFLLFAVGGFLFLTGRLRMPWMIEEYFLRRGYSPAANSSRQVDWWDGRGAGHGLNYNRNHRQVRHIVDGRR